MRRIQPPLCTICNSQNAAFESDVWPSLMLCTKCRTESIEYILESGVIHGNPILIELSQPGDNGNRSDAIRIWRPRQNQTSVYYEFFIRLTDESGLPVDNQLDILNDL